jgi:hypothetical protein
MAIKPTKHIEVGEVKRVDEIESQSMVRSGYWKYTPKSEYKKYLGTVDYAIIINSNPDSTKEIIPKKKRAKKH